MPLPMPEHFAPFRDCSEKSPAKRKAPRFRRAFSLVLDGAQVSRGDFYIGKFFFLLGIQGFSRGDFSVFRGENSGDKSRFTLGIQGFFRGKNYGGRNRFGLGIQGASRGRFLFPAPQKSPARRTSPGIMDALSVTAAPLRIPCSFSRSLGMSSDRQA